MKRILLYGRLRAKFGREFRLDVATPAEAIHALGNQIQGFAAHLRKYSAPGYHVIVGKTDRDADELENPMGEGETIKIIPAVAGAKSDGFKIIFGAVLVVAGSYLKQPWMVNIGAAMILGGVAGLLAPSALYDPFAGDKGPSDTPSYAFSGPHLTVGQGNPVPVLLGGPLRIGGAIISMGISTGSWQKNGLGGKGDEANPGTATGNGDTTPWVWAKKPA